MSLQFEKVVGAVADAHELEYIAALHQTQDDDDNTFQDGSIEATDVKNFLMSRYSVQVTKEDVRESIFRDLAGGNSGDDCIDIVELVAILIIPYLRRVSMFDMNDEDPSRTVEEIRANLVSIFEKDAFEKRMKLQEAIGETHTSLIVLVLELIMTEVKGSSDPKPLTKELLREIFEAYDEEGLIEDDGLLTEMIELATGGDPGGMLDAAAFSRGLTSDIELYDPRNESKLSTHFDDVFGSSNFTLDKTDDDTKQVPQLLAFNQIDSLADTFREKLQYVFSWIAVLSGFVSYFKIFDEFGITICKEGQGNKFLCEIAESVSVWCAIMVTMICVFSPCMMILSLGNSGYKNSLFEILLAMIGIGILIFFPAYYRELDTGLVSTKKDLDAGYISDTLFFVNVTVGSILLFIQIRNLICYFVPDAKVAGNKLLTFILKGSGVKIEFGTKEAAMSKVHKMMHNAYRLHTTEKKKGARKVPQRSNALLNYEKETEKREPCGGFFWAWKRYVMGNILNEEGITIHTRLLAGNLAQFGTAVLFLILGLFILAQLVRDIFAEVAPENSACPSAFDPSDCYFPQFNGTSLGVGMCFNVFLGDSSCLDEFQEIGGTTRDTLCETIDILELQEGPVISEMFNYTCPSLYAPYPSAIYTSTAVSTKDNYCAAPITACAPTGEISGGYSAVCVIGIVEKIPYNFYGSGCTEHINDPDFDVMLQNKEDFDNAIEDSGIVPKKWMLRLSGTIGITVAFLAGFFNSAVNIPSQITSILKYRTGEIETLHNAQFKLYRKSLLNTTNLIGSMLWGTLLMSIVIAGVVGGVVFLCVYKFTQPYVIKFISVLLGVMVTMILKMIVCMLLNKLGFIGFYRKRPFLANVSNLTLECWHLATSTGYMVMRVVKLLIVTFIYLGRFDKPILADGVGVFGPVKMDTIPLVFQMDILATEAHRHPYIERLGMIYLMKLRHPRFGCKAGSTWRLLFCFALMPWLRKYRIADAPQDEDDYHLQDDKDEGTFSSSAVGSNETDPESRKGPSNPEKTTVGTAFPEWQTSSHQAGLQSDLFPHLMNDTKNDPQHGKDQGVPAFSSSAVGSNETDPESRKGPSNPEETTVATAFPELQSDLPPHLVNDTQIL